MNCNDKEQYFIVNQGNAYQKILTSIKNQIVT